jgi:NAD+ kinase
VPKPAIERMALYVDVRREAAVQAARSIAAIAARNGVRLQVPHTQKDVLCLDGVASPDDFPATANLLVSLGGDGTLLQAAHAAGPRGIPIVGVDFGRVGFLTEVGRAGYEEALERIMREGVRTEPHLALSARIPGDEQSFYAVNDIHVDRRRSGHIVYFGIELSGEKVATIPADGIVVASPTGSTAYFLSAGGPIMAPSLQAIGIAPLAPHTLFSRPLVVGADEVVRIVVPRESAGTQLFVDGQHVRDLEPGACVEVVRAPEPVHFVRLNNGYFFQTLERKLHWGMSLKQSLE